MCEAVTERRQEETRGDRQESRDKTDKIRQDETTTPLRFGRADHDIQRSNLTSPCITWMASDQIRSHHIT